MLELIFAVALVAGLGALFGGAKGARIAVASVFILAVLAVVGALSYGAYSEHEKSTQLAAQEKAEEQHRPLDSDVPKGLKAYAYEDCTGKPWLRYDDNVNCKPAKPAPQVARHYVYATSDLSVTSELIANGILLGHIVTGEKVELIESEPTWHSYRIRTASGVVGWVYGNQVLSATMPVQEQQPAPDAPIQTKGQWTAESCKEVGFTWRNGVCYVLENGSTTAPPRASGSY